MKVLVTGGAGFIGSTVCSALANEAMTPVILDSLVTGRREFAAGHLFYEGDVADASLVRCILRDHPDIDVVIHCAALIDVPESINEPGRYYECNVSRTLAFLQTLRTSNVRKFIFSSSASVYGDATGGAVDENAAVEPASPYARSKLMTEFILSDFARSHGLRTLALRYFNPIGADPELRTGQHLRFPSHALGRLISVHAGREREFVVAGGDWPTRDGSAVRDYIHVWDLARAHMLAVRRFDDVFAAPVNASMGFSGLMTDYRVLNLGTGRGCTVLELIKAFESTVGCAVPWRVGPRRQGDVAGAFADAGLASNLLGWKSEFSLEAGVADALRWNERFWTRH
ncbi:MAG: UDP-glucose 4-epimerase GalE [Silvanigrellales bacterium]|jgi:UDP-glucose 4-epimerase|nr:UDP-glucose 4-epimerase GalE [Silvanigrellales bacterium]